MYNNSGFYSYESSPATGFLNNNLQNTMNAGSGALNGQFANVMNSMSTGVTQNVQRGIVPGTVAASNLSPAQIAAQMNMGGVTSVLPMLGNKFIPKLVFPIAGAWSLYDGVKSMNHMSSELKTEAAFSRPYDPSMSNYNQAVARMHAFQDENKLFGY